MLLFIAILIEFAVSDRSKRGMYPRLELWKSRNVLEVHQSFLATLVEYGLDKDAAIEIYESNPFLRQLDFKYSLLPKLKYLKHTVASSQAKGSLSNIKYFPQYFSFDLEKNIALKISYLSLVDHRFHSSLLLDGDCSYFRKICIADEITFCSNFARTSFSEFESFKKSFFQGGLAAVRNMDVKMVKIFLEQGWHPFQEVDRSGRTALMWACSLGSHSSGLNMVRQLVEFEMNADKEDVLHDKNSLSSDGESCFHFTSAGGSLQVCKYLLEEAGLESRLLKEGNKDLTTPLHWAAGSGSVEVMRWLAEEHNCSVNTKNAFGCTAAHFAASAGQIGALQYLQSVGADLTLENFHGHDPVTKAVAYKRNDALLWLLQQLPESYSRVAVGKRVRWSEQPGGEETMIPLQQIASIVGNSEAIHILSQHSQLT